MLYIRVLLDPV
uniref:Uncharacterized protein n=1 Tax=Rhizophora mucronata TaxID=61149 RepID=A0A2P2NCJ1_RHIMU